VPNVLKSESLEHVETSGPVQACNGIALSLPLVQSTVFPIFFFTLYKAEGSKSLAQNAVIDLGRKDH
jgi:hypothetical protein